MDPGQRGKWGEKIAHEYLKKANYKIITGGFRSRFGEIDIIAANEEFIVFAEVKTRKNAAFAYAREHVTKTKQKKMIKTANYWLMKKPTKLQPRFDVIEVYASNGELTVSPGVIHIENAFGAG